MTVSVSDCYYRYLDEFFRVRLRRPAEAGAASKCQMIDEKPTPLAKKLTLELQF
jgi:hypothetical protein